MQVSFELSMPNNNSWNGKWTGDGECYCVVRTLKEPPKLGRYSYNFGDGWRAAIDVREVTSSAAKSLKKKSKGFCGYEWMIDSIIRHGDIRTENQAA